MNSIISSRVNFEKSICKPRQFFALDHLIKAVWAFFAWTVRNLNFIQNKWQKHMTVTPLRLKSVFCNWNLSQVVLTPKSMWRQTVCILLSLACWFHTHGNTSGEDRVQSICPQSKKAEHAWNFSPLTWTETQSKAEEQVHLLKALVSQEAILNKDRLTDIQQLLCEIKGIPLINLATFSEWKTRNFVAAALFHAITINGDKRFQALRMNCFHMNCALYSKSYDRRLIFEYHSLI